MDGLKKGKILWPVLPAAAILVLSCMVMAAYTGMRMPLAALALAVLGIWLPGRVLAGIAGARSFGLLWTASGVFGIALFAVCTVLGSASGLHWLPWLSAVLGAAGTAVLWRKGDRFGLSVHDEKGRHDRREPQEKEDALRRRERQEKESAHPAAWVCAAVLALMAFYCLACAPAFAHAAAAGGMVAPEHDFLWNVGNAKSFLRGFPPQDLRFSGYTLTYHYLSELLCAGLAMASGADCYEVQGALLPLLGIAFTVGALWELGGTLYRGSKGSRKKQAALLALTFLCGSASLWKVLTVGERFFNLSLYHVLTNINGMGFALGLAAAFFAAAAVLFVRDGTGTEAAEPVLPQSAAADEMPEETAAAGKAANKTAHPEKNSSAARRWPHKELAAGTSLQEHAGSPVGLWILGSAAFALLCFAKGPIAGVAVLALVCAAAVRFLGAALAGKARRGVPVLVWSLALLAAFGALYAGFFSAGAGTSVRFDPLGTLQATYFSNFVLLTQQKLPALLWLAVPLLALAHTVCFAPAAAPLALWGGAADVPRILRLSGAKLLLYAGFIGGFAAFFLFFHGSASQMYFAFLGLLCANALAVENAGALAARWKRRGKWLLRICAAPLAALALAGLLTTAFSAAALWRDAAPVYSRAYQEDGRDLPLTANEEQAMAWLAENTPETALLATNRAHTGVALEGLSNVYSGLSGRQFYMESFKYAHTNLGVSGEEISRRIDEMKALFGDAVTPEQAAALCRSAGIDYVVYSRWAARHTWDITEGPMGGIFAGDAPPEGFALVFENDDVAVYEVLKEVPAA